MRVRCAIFEGTVEEKVLPILSSFPRIRSARVLRTRSVEDNGPPVYQVFELQFDSEADVAEALASPNRAKSRAALAEIMPLFRGRVYHLNLSLSQRP